MRKRMGLLALLVVTACSDGDRARDGGTTVDAGTSGAVYRVFALVGALDRIAILRADAEADTCGRARLVTPAGGEASGITTPLDWAVEIAGVSEGSSDCFADPTTYPDVESAGGSGEVTFQVAPGMVYPTALSIDATITFDTTTAPAWVPADLAFTVTDIALE